MMNESAAEPESYSMHAPEEAYSLLCDEREELCELFSREDSRGDPLLVIYNGNDEFEVYPDRPESYEPRSLPPDIPAAYNSDSHAVRADKEEIPEERTDDILRHELSHSVIGGDMSFVKADQDSFSDFEGYSNTFASVSNRVIEELFTSQISVRPEEFFPALGAAHLQNGEQNLSLDRWQEDLIDYQCGDLSDSESEDARKAIETIVHLPQMAGELLVNQYDGNVETILEDHPEILEADGERLWEEYCVPILKDGGLQ